MHFRQCFISVAARWTQSTYALPLHGRPDPFCTLMTRHSGTAHHVRSTKNLTAIPAEASLTPPSCHAGVGHPATRMHPHL